jgi:hypothetical protein
MAPDMTTMDLEQAKCAQLNAQTSGIGTSPSQPEHIMQFFTYAHLPPALQDVSVPFEALAQGIVRNLPRNPERTVALRKLLEAKDAAVRAFIAK